MAEETIHPHIPHYEGMYQMRNSGDPSEFFVAVYKDYEEFLGSKNIIVCLNNVIICCKQITKHKQ